MFFRLSKHVLSYYGINAINDCWGIQIQTAEQLQERGRGWRTDVVNLPRVAFMTAMPLTTRRGSTDSLEWQCFGGDERGGGMLALWGISYFEDPLHLETLGCVLHSRGVGGGRGLTCWFYTSLRTPQKSTHSHTLAYPTLRDRPLTHRPTTIGCSHFLYTVSPPLWPVLTLSVGTWHAVPTKLGAILNNFSSFDQRGTPRWLVQYRSPQETADSICLVKQLKDKNQSPSNFYLFFCFPWVMPL